MSTTTSPSYTEITPTNIRKVAQLLRKKHGFCFEISQFGFIHLWRDFRIEIHKRHFAITGFYRSDLNRTYKIERILHHNNQTVKALVNSMCSCVAIGKNYRFITHSRTPGFETMPWSMFPRLFYVQNDTNIEEFFRDLLGTLFEKEGFPRKDFKDYINAAVAYAVKDFKNGMAATINEQVERVISEIEHLERLRFP